VGAVIVSLIAWNVVASRRKAKRNNKAAGGDVKM
jgi:hypothetical protein